MPKSSRKCPICNHLLGYEVSDTANVVPYKNRYAHITCFNNAMRLAHQSKNQELADKAAKKKTVAKKKSYELKAGLSEEEYQIKKGFFDKIKELTGQSELDVKIYKVAEDYINKYKFTYASMLTTLEYYFDILENEVKGDTVGIIPYYHDRAKEYFNNIKITCDNNQRILDDSTIEQMYQHKTIHMLPHKKKVRQIDISAIGGEDDE